MATLVPPPVEVLSQVLCGDDKRRVNFRIVRSNAPGAEYQFGFMECFYCDKHLTWHAQHNEAYVPVSAWQKLVSYAEHIEVYSKPIVDQLVQEKSNDGTEENEELREAKPIRNLVPQMSEYCGGSEQR